MELHINLMFKYCSNRIYLRILPSFLNKILVMKVIDRTKAVTQHFLENSFKKLSIKKKIKKIKIRKTQKYMFSKFLLRHDVVRVFVSSLVLVFVWAILPWCP